MIILPPLDTRTIPLTLLRNHGPHSNNQDTHGCQYDTYHVYRRKYITETLVHTCGHLPNTTIYMFLKAFPTSPLGVALCLSVPQTSHNIRATRLAFEVKKRFHTHHTCYKGGVAKADSSTGRVTRGDLMGR